MDPSMQQQPQYYYAPGAPTGAAPPGYYPQAGSGDAAAANGYVLPMQQQPQLQHMQQQQPQHMMYYAPPAPGYAYAAPMYYQPPDAAFSALSLSGQALLPMQQQQQQPQPQQTPGASSTTSNGSQPRAASTPIPTEEPTPVPAAPQMIPMHVMYTQMPQYYPIPGYEGAPQMMPMVYQDPTTGQMMQHHPHPMQQTMQHMQQQQQAQAQHQQFMNRMMSTDPDAAPENIDDISQISHQSSPDSFMDTTPGLHNGRHPTTPVSSIRRRVSLPPTNQNNGGGGSHMSNMMPSNYKTRLCTQWMEKRECSMGGSCKFAHGNVELRMPERPFRAINNPKYKTKMCKNFEPGANGQCAYAERCEYIHPTDREYAAYKARLESMARARGDFPRFKAMLDEVPGAPRSERGGRGDEENKSVRSSADSSCGGDRDRSGAASPPPARGRRGSAREGGYLGSALPPSVARSAIRMGAGADRVDAYQPRAQPLGRGFTGGSMYNLASGTYTDRDEYNRGRLTRVPSASNVASLGGGHGGFGGGRGGRYNNPQPAKFNRRASMTHLNSAADY